MDRNALLDRVHEGIIVCSDRRPRPTLDGLYNNGRRVIVSTGGANVASVSDTVRELTARASGDGRYWRTPIRLTLPKGADG